MGHALRDQFIRSVWRTLGAIALLGVAVSAFESQATESAAEQAFIRENASVMNRMMQNMSAKPSGDVDADFVNMMEPHHQGAIDMARLELRYGRNEQLRRIAQEIVVDQQQEIVAMRIALGRPLPPEEPTPDQDKMNAMPGMSAPKH